MFFVQKSETPFSREQGWSVGVIGKAPLGHRSLNMT